MTEGFSDFLFIKLLNEKNKIDLEFYEPLQAMLGATEEENNGEEAPIDGEANEEAKEESQWI